MDPLLKSRLILVYANIRILDAMERLDRETSPQDNFFIRISPEKEEDEGECDMDFDPSECGMDDGSIPAGPRNEPDNSRYQLSPGHGQHLVDMISTTAGKE